MQFMNNYHTFNLEVYKDADTIIVKSGQKARDEPVLVRYGYDEKVLEEIVLCDNLTNICVIKIISVLSAVEIKEHCASIDVDAIFLAGRKSIQHDCNVTKDIYGYFNDQITKITSIAGSLELTLRSENGEFYKFRVVV